MPHRVLRYALSDSPLSPSGYKNPFATLDIHGITTHVSNTTSNVTNTTFCTRNGSPSRKGPVKSEITIETGNAAHHVTTACRALVGGERTFCPGSVNQVSSPESVRVPGGAIVRCDSRSIHAWYSGELCHASSGCWDANLYTIR